MSSIYDATRGVSVICIFNSRVKLERYLLPSLEVQSAPYETLLIDNTGNPHDSPAKLLNDAVRRARFDNLMFVHQDVSLESRDWLSDALHDLRNLPDLGAAGVAGKTAEAAFVANVASGDPPRFIGLEKIVEPVEVQTLDGCLLLVQRQVFNRFQFDEAMSGWYLYVANYCLDLLRAGLRCYVLPRLVYHESPGPDTSRIQGAVAYLLARHGDHVEAVNTTMGEWPTISGEDRGMH